MRWVGNWKVEREGSPLRYAEGCCRGSVAICIASDIVLAEFEACPVVGRGAGSAVEF